MTKSKSSRLKEVPLYLIPQAITRLLRKHGGKVYRVSVCRTRHHHYNVSVRTRSLPKELRSGCGLEPTSSPERRGIV